MNKKCLRNHLKDHQTILNCLQKQQWEIDKNLGILDWKGDNLTKEEKDRFIEHYD